MKRKNRQTLTLQRQIVTIILLCWLIPVLMVLGIMGWYFSDSISQRTAENMSDQFQVSMQVCSERLDTAIESSRAISTDATVKNAWTEYNKNGYYADLYQNTQRFLEKQYRSDSRLLFAAFAFSEDPATMRAFAYNQGSGVSYQTQVDYWDNDAGALLEFAGELDTSIGFLMLGKQLYLVRNVMAASYTPIGTLVLALNTPYYFENLETLTWAEQTTVFLNDTVVPLEETAIDASEVAQNSGHSGLSLFNPNYVTLNMERSWYTVTAIARVDLMLGQLYGYWFLLVGMAVLLIPLLVFTVRFLRRRVSEPVDVLMGGAREIEQGELGYQLDYSANSREFKYLTNSFNQMSGQLQHQFNSLYQEELALRDAKIKALQSHINPHFLNNTLEIINWEARMSGDIKVSKMIEALSTILDANLARDKRPEVPVSEELQYVASYLYIIGERFGRRLFLTQTIDPNILHYMVPRLIMQPVIENAVEHGIGPGGHGKIDIRGFLQGDTLIIEIENDRGMTQADEARIAELLSPDYETGLRDSSSSIGIANVNQRLRILYGGQSGLSIERGTDKQVIARIKIEVREQNED